MKVLFIIAHPDDEAYGPYGTIIKHVREGHDVKVYSLCNGARPGAEDVAIARALRFKQNCELAGATDSGFFDNNDLSINIELATNLVSKLVDSFKPDIVYTHNISDVNRDHRIVAEAVMVACRPKPDSSVNALYFFEVPSSTDWSFNQIEPAFVPNTYVSLSKDIVKLKVGALSAYDTETYEFPDARSVEAMKTLLKYRGYQVGVDAAEAFKAVFQRL